MISKHIFLEENDETHIALDFIYPKVEEVLNTSVGKNKFNRLVGMFIDKNSSKIHTPGPQYMIPFADNDKAEFFKLFDLDPKAIKKKVVEITTSIEANSDFKLLRNNPIFWLFYFCIRYFELHGDKQSLNSALIIYAFSSYPSIFYTFFRYEPNEVYMVYTMNHLSNKFIMRQEGDLFGGLFKSISNSYDRLLKNHIEDASDRQVIRFIQRIHNDQKSMIKNICDVYMMNRKLDKKIILNQTSNMGDGEEVIIDDNENNTSIVDVLANKITVPLVMNSIDMERLKIASKLSQISFSESRFYLTKIITVNYTDEIKDFVSALLFLYLYVEKRKKEDINSKHFIVWSNRLFRKTNSKDINITTIKTLLDKWGDDSGIHKKYKREATRLNYKKSIFWYFILSIQALV